MRSCGFFVLAMRNALYFLHRQKIIDLRNENGYFADNVIYYIQKQKSKSGWRESMRYLSVAEIAKKWNVSERSVRNYCANGRVPGAFLTGKTWNVPEDAVKPER